MNHFITKAFLVLGVACIAHAQDIPNPTLREGDKWIHKVKSEEMPQGSSSKQWASEITRINSIGVLFSNKPADSNLPVPEKLLAQDWTESASLAGKKTITRQLFKFPLYVGKTWEVAFTHDNPNDKVKLAKFVWRYQVLGWEDVKVPAGTFKAMKIEATGDWYNEYMPTNAVAGSVVESGAAGNSVSVQTRNSTTPSPRTGKLYQAIWYSPEVKREVKFINESYSQTDALSKRITVELESFAVLP